MPNEKKIYEYDTILHEIKDKGGAYVAFPIIGVRKEIRTRLNKMDGDNKIHVTIQTRE